MVEVFDKAGNLDGLDFTFGPSGAYFSPELELNLRGDYINGTNYTLVNEAGEALKFTLKKNEREITFYLPDFSSYSFDLYD